MRRETFKNMVIGWSVVNIDWLISADNDSALLNKPPAVNSERRLFV